jgi:hypothetical protein
MTCDWVQPPASAGEAEPVRAFILSVLHQGWELSRYFYPVFVHQLMIRVGAFKLGAGSPVGVSFAVGRRDIFTLDLLIGRALILDFRWLEVRWHSLAHCLALLLTDRFPSARSRSPATLRSPAVPKTHTNFEMISWYHAAATGGAESMAPTMEFAVRVNFRRDDDGYCYIDSPDVIGLHLAGSDIDTLRAELDTIIKDLVWHNHGRIIDRIRWIPSLDQISQKYSDANASKERSEICVVQVEEAAA